VKRTKYIYAAAIAVVFGILPEPGNPMIRVAKADPADTTQVPKFELDPFWPKPLPQLWVTGEVGGTCVDAQDHVFILNRQNLTPDEQKNAQPAPPVMELEASPPSKPED
jgi:hypothetical protein